MNLQTMEARALYPTRKQVVDKEARKRYLNLCETYGMIFRGAAALGTFNGQRSYELNNLYRASCAKADIKLDGLRYVDISTIHADYDSETIKNTLPGFIFDTYQPAVNVRYTDSHPYLRKAIILLITKPKLCV